MPVVPGKNITSFLSSLIFVASFQAATSSCQLMRAGVAQGGVISPVLFSLYMNDIPTFSRHIELVQYTDNTALVVTLKQLAFLVRYLETHLADVEIWLRDWRIAINVVKRVAVPFTTTPIPPPRPLRYLGVEIRWEKRVKYLGVSG